MKASKVRELRRRQRRVRKLRELKRRLAQTKDAKERERLLNKLQRISYYKTIPEL